MNCAICIWPRVSLPKPHFVWRNCCCTIRTATYIISDQEKFVTQWYEQITSRITICPLIIVHDLQGGIENIEQAKTYYSQAVKLNPNNLRALYGLYLVILVVLINFHPESVANALSLQCCNQISNSRLTVNKKKDAQKLGQLILKKIQAKYDTEADEDTVNCVSITALENAFGSLDIKSN